MKKVVVVAVLLFLLGLVVKLGYFSSSHYAVTTPIIKNLFSIKTEKTPVVTTRPEDSGICAPPGCGNPAGINGEDVSLALTAEQLTSLINQYTPSSVPLKNIRVAVTGQVIYAAADSAYPVLPGQLSASARLDINHFYVNDVYVGGVKTPQKVANFVEANLAGLIDRSFSKYSVRLLEMRLEAEKLFIKVNAPKGTVVVNGDGTVTLNLVEAASGTTDPSYSDPRNRF